MNDHVVPHLSTSADIDRLSSVTSAAIDGVHADIEALRAHIDHQLANLKLWAVMSNITVGGLVVALIKLL